MPVTIGEDVADELLKKMCGYVGIVDASATTGKDLEIWPDGCLYDLAFLCRCAKRYVPERYRVRIEGPLKIISVRSVVDKPPYIIEYALWIAVFDVYDYWLAYPYNVYVSVRRSGQYVG
ncbi:MAG: hypothetical protein DRZ76_04065, partial [Candidatus Nealsonbacteria bacterium]